MQMKILKGTKYLGSMQGDVEMGTRDYHNIVLMPEENETIEKTEAEKTGKDKSKEIFGSFDFDKFKKSPLLWLVGSIVIYKIFIDGGATK